MADIDELEKILENHEKRLTALEKSNHSQSKFISINDESAITRLLEAGFFDTPKKLSDITKELKTKAKFNKNAKYPLLLKKFTNEEKLIRRQVHHQWVYIKND